MIPLFAALLGLLPLLWIPVLHQQFELPKFLYILVLGAVVCLCAGLRLIQKKPWNALPTPLLVAGGAWMLYLTLQTFFVSPLLDWSLWGSYERHTGLLLWLVLMLVFVFVAMYPWTLQQRKRLFFLFALSGTLVALLAVGQGIVHGATGLLAQLGGRVYGTFGVPNFLGQWLLLVLPLPIYFFLHAQGKVRGLWMGSILLHVVALVLTQNRASLLALCGATAIFLVLLLLRRRSLRPLLVGGFVVLVLLAATTLLRPEGALRTIVTRSYLYPMAVEALVESPWFGYGLDTGYAVFAPRLPQDLAQVEQLGFVPDKVHQGVLDMLVEVGVVGTLLFAVLMATFLLLVLRQLVHLPAEDRGFVSLLLLGLLLWCVSLLVSFPGVTERLGATVFLAMIVHMCAGGPRRTFPRLMSVLPLMLSPLLLVLASSTFLADLDFARLPHSVRPQDFPQLLHRTPLHLEYAVFGANGSMPSVTTEDRARSLHLALQKNPEDPWALIFLADVHRLEGNIPAMRTLLLQAENSCPRCSFVLLAGARLEYLQGDTALARGWAEKYWDLLPEFVTNSGVTMPSHLGDRRRLILKEQKADIAFISALLERPLVPAAP